MNRQSVKMVKNFELKIPKRMVFVLIWFLIYIIVVVTDITHFQPFKKMMPDLETAHNHL